MPRVNFIKSARKDNTAVKAGEPYFWWRFRHGAKQYSRTAPKRQQLTQSKFLIAVYDIEDMLHAFDGVDDLQSICDKIDNLHSETEEKLNNMPEHLQDCSPAGKLMTQRMDDLDKWHGYMQKIVYEWDNLDPEEREEQIAEHRYQGN